MICPYCKQPMKEVERQEYEAENNTLIIYLCEKDSHMDYEQEHWSIV